MKYNRKFQSILGTATALVLTASLFGANILPAMAAPASQNEPIVQSGPGGAFTPTSNLPLIESQLGLGTRLSGGVATEVDIPNFSQGSALVRVSALSPENELLLSATGVPALSTPAGVSASTTVLVPVVQGKFTLLATQDTDIRVEVISTFTDGELGAGGTKALDVPINRADSKEAYGIGAQAGAENVGVSVVGKGGVPSTDVRAAYVTVVTTAVGDSTLSIEGVKQTLHSGTNVITTIASVSELGTVDIASDAAETQVFVRGFVRSAMQNESTQTIENGFNARVGSLEVALNVTDGAPASVDVLAPTDATHVLVAVSAQSATESTFLQVGASLPSRGNGVITSPQEPTNSQIVLAELDEHGELPVAVRFGSSNLSIKLLGSLAGKATREGQSSALTITSPQANAAVDLREVGTFTVSGTITTQNSSLDRVDVKTGGQVIGTARAQRTSTGYDISFQTSVPTAGEHTLEFDASFRDAAKAEADLTVSVTLPEVADTVISEDTVVQYGDDAVEVLRVSADSILYAADPGVVPGQILVGRDNNAASEGYLRRVSAVEASDGGYMVLTEVATITDVILQADVSEQIGLITDEGTQLFPVNSAEPSDLLVDTNEGPDARAMPAPAMSRMDVSGAIDASVGESISLEVLLGFKKEHETDVSNTSASHNQKKPEIKAAGGIQLSGESKLSVALVFELKVTVEFGWWQSPKANLDKFKVAVERTLETSVGASAFGSFEASWKKDLPNWNIGTVTFLLGPVPVVITSEAGIDLVAKVSAEVKAEIGWTGKESQQYGFEYLNGQLHAVSPWPPVQNAPISIKNGYSLEESAGLTFEGEASASVGPELEFQISIYDAAGPVVSAGALLGASADFKMGEDINWEIFLEGTIGVSVRLEVPIIDQVLLEATVVAEHKKKWELLSGTIPWNDFWKFGPDDPETGEEGGDGEVGLDPIEIPEYSFEGSSLRATLYWDNSSDLDLHVQEPSGEWIDYGNPGPSATGGLLDIDAFAGCSATVFPFAGGLENVTWQVGSKAGPGKYLIEIDEWSRCGFDEHAKWVLKVYVDEKLRYQQSGNSEQQFSFTLEDSANMRSRMAAPAEAVQEMDLEEAAQHPEGTKAP